MTKNHRLLISAVGSLLLAACAGSSFDQNPSPQIVDTPSTPSSSNELKTSTQSTQGADSDSSLTYSIVDTGQDHCYSDQAGISCPEAEERFYGQDAQYQGLSTSYQENGDGTVTDLVTGLMWGEPENPGEKMTYQEALDGEETFTLGGYDDWRLPTIKELYSLIDFRGSASQGIPYLDLDYFSFRYGDESAGERQIDAQYWSSTEYTGTTMNGNFTVFGVNFADGRIKGYPAQTNTGREMEGFVLYVRGNPDYGMNNFVDQNDGTIADLASGLVWQAADSAVSLDWEGALDYCESLNLAGEDDWRLPNAKELQSIVDYSRSPQTSGTAAIDPIFAVSEVESWYWSSTTHLDTSPANAVYLAFGQAYGLPNGDLIDVHGAGAQRSDPKSGDPAEYASGRGTEGQDDQVRIYNYARCVRGGISENITTGGDVDPFTGIEGRNQPQERQSENLPEPPLEAVEACQEGATCSFTAPERAISGTCQTVPSGQFACVPDNAPPN